MDYRLTPRQVWKTPGLFFLLLLAILTIVTPKRDLFSPSWWMTTLIVSGMTIILFALILVVPHVRRMRRTILRIS